MTQFDPQALSQPASRVERALESARSRYPDPVWIALDRGARAAALYHELCRIDSGCQRTGGAADEALPPCLAAESFIARRYCAVSGRRPAAGAVRGRA